MFDRHSRTAAILLSAALLLGTVSFAAAAESHSVMVQSRDLNLASDAGRSQLRHRIARALDAVCGSAHGRTTEEVQAYASCSKAAQASAATQFNVLVAAAQNAQKVASDRSAAAALR